MFNCASQVLTNTINRLFYTQNAKSQPADPQQLFPSPRIRYNTDHIPSYYGR